ncbi:MAG: T9SS type B sorting domain-containing protein, partial [Bacteroidota bacterium]
ATGARRRGSDQGTVTITPITAGSITSVAGGVDTVFVCDGTEFNLVAELVNSDAPAETFTWFYNNMSAVGTDVTFEAAVSSTATFNYQYGRSQEDICEVLTATVFVQVNPGPDLDLLADTETCAVDLNEFTLNDGLTSDDATYEWTSSVDGVFSTDINPVVMPTQTTTYSVLGTSPGCPDEQGSVTITVIEAGSLAGVTDDIEICAGEEINLAAVVVPSSNGVNSFNWNYDGNTVGDLNATFTVGNSGNAVFVYGYGGSIVECGTQSLSVAIEAIEAPNPITLDNPTLCFNDDLGVMLTDTDPQPGVTYEWTWTDEDGVTQSSMDLNEEFTPSVTTEYTLTSTLVDCQTTQTATITVTPAITVDLGDNILVDDGICPTVTAVIEPLTAVEYEWFAVTASEPDMLDTTQLQFIESQIDLGASTLDCEDGLPITILVNATSACETVTDEVQIVNTQFEIPEIFSPDNNGTNDVFRPFTADGVYSRIDVNVYNRWGKLVFESSDATNTGWDGTFNGEPAPSDAYLYKIDLYINDQLVEELRGSVTLVR